MYGKIIEGKPQGSNEATSPISALQFYLAGTGFHQVIGQVNRTFIGIGVEDIGFNLFCIKKAQLPQFSDTSDDIVLAVALSRPGPQFAEDHMVIGLVVTAHRYMVQESFLSFDDPYFKVNGIVLCGDFNRIDL